MTDLESDWSALCARFGLSFGIADGWAMLTRAYAAPPRAYHDLSHIADCLAQLDAWYPPAKEADVVRMALYWHDAIYDARARDNEERSAKMWVAFAHQFEVSPELRERVFTLIMVTRHVGSAAEPDAQLIQDIDLSILGREESRFDQYEEAIREEYSWVGDTDYAQGRSEFLESLLNRDRIFLTDYGIRSFESEARANIVRSLNRLRSGH